MRIQAEFTDKDLRALVLKHLRATLPRSVAHFISLENLQFLVKSKNNYKAQEWEQGTLRVTVDAEVITDDESDGGEQ